MSGNSCQFFMSRSERLKRNNLAFIPHVAHLLGELAEVCSDIDHQVDTTIVEDGLQTVRVALSPLQRNDLMTGDLSDRLNDIFQHNYSTFAVSRKTDAL